MTEVILSNAMIVLEDEIVEGTIQVKGGRIASIDTGPSRFGQDFEGDFLIPGLVELHTDHLESHFHPRPGVEWSPVGAVIAHDAQIAAAGITTVFDALRAGSFDPSDLSARSGERLAKAIHAAKDEDTLRCQHFIHLRCELPCSDTVDVAGKIIEAGGVRLLSVMDHTPGARQFTSIEKFKEYYLGKKLILPEKIDGYIAEKREMQALYAARNKQEMLSQAHALGLTLASHDDATEDHVMEALADGSSIAEFPTTAESAEAAHRLGLAVLMGAPNVVRGSSHSGNIAATQVAANGQLDILSSDYVPVSLLTAAFALPRRVDSISLPEALHFVTRNPARATGLDDRGVITPGLRADLVRVKIKGETPLVRGVWREGQRVL